MKRFFYLILVIALPLIAEWQYPSSVNIMNPQEGWVRIYGDVENDCGYCIEQTFDNGYIISGRKGSALWILRLDDKGDTLWTKVYEGGSLSNYGYSIQETSDTNYIIASFNNVSKPWGLDFDIWLLKINRNGDTVWTRTYSLNTTYDWGYSAKETKDHGFIILAAEGYHHSPGWLIKTDDEGYYEWSVDFEGSADWSTSWLEVTSDDKYIVVAQRYIEGSRDFLLVKFDEYGNTMWYRTYGSGVGEYVQETFDGGYIATGWLDQSDDDNVLLIKTNKEGIVEWEKMYGGEYNDRGYCVRQTYDKGYIVTGYTVFQENGGDLYLIKTNPIGDTLWTISYGGPAGESGSSLIQTSDGGYVITGWTTSYSAGGSDLWVIRTDSLGRGLILEISPTKIITPKVGGYITPIIPEAEFTNLGSEDYIGDFYCKCEIVDPIYHSNYYRDSILVNDLESWQTIAVEFTEWSNIDVANYAATFWAEAVEGNSFPSRPMTVSFFWGGITEQQPDPHQPDWQVVTAVGNCVLLSSQSEERSHLSVFDASGRQVDEVVLDGLGIVSWGVGFSPGVYFFREAEGSQTQKAILIK